jgi:hypothetical protein
LPDNIYRCIILDVLSENNAKELTPLYCKTDDWLAQALPKISWERTKTLGYGDDCCDFRWGHIKKSTPSQLTSPSSPDEKLNRKDPAPRNSAGSSFLSIPMLTRNLEQLPA